MINKKIDSIDKVDSSCAILPEALTAFVEAVACGRFLPPPSAAQKPVHHQHRHFKPEADLGVALFDRATRHPTLTPQGNRC